MGTPYIQSQNQTLLSKWLKISLLVSAFFLLGLGGYSQAMMNDGTHLVDSKLTLKGVEFSGDYVIINYEIPYNGMVEIRLFNKAGDKIWQSQYVNKWGPNRIVMKAGKFVSGETYAYQLNYKTDEVSSQILIPDHYMSE